MARVPDEYIPATESLYRGLRPDWVQDDRVLPDAIDLNGMSVNRAEYSGPESVLTKDRTKVATVAPQDFPPPIVLNEVAWEFIAVDLPLDGNDAHAEVRPHRQGDATIEARKPGSSEAKRKLRARLADVMKVIPTPAPN